jgi:hypothetical protein
MFVAAVAHPALVPLKPPLSLLHVVDRTLYHTPVCMFSCSSRTQPCSMLFLGPLSTTPWSHPFAFLFTFHHRVLIVPFSFNNDTLGIPLSLSIIAFLLLPVDFLEPLDHTLGIPRCFPFTSFPLLLLLVVLFSVCKHHNHCLCLAMLPQLATIIFSAVSLPRIDSKYLVLLPLYMHTHTATCTLQQLFTLILYSTAYLSCMQVHFFQAVTVSMPTFSPGSIDAVLLSSQTYIAFSIQGSDTCPCTQLQHTQAI